MIGVRECKCDFVATAVMLAVQRDGSVDTFCNAVEHLRLVIGPFVARTPFSRASAAFNFDVQFSTTLDVWQ